MTGQDQPQRQVLRLHGRTHLPGGSDPIIGGPRLSWGVVYNDGEVALPGSGDWSAEFSVNGMVVVTFDTPFNSVPSIQVTPQFSGEWDGDLSFYDTGYRFAGTGQNPSNIPVVSDAVVGKYALPAGTPWVPNAIQAEVACTPGGATITAKGAIYRDSLALGPDIKLGPTIGSTTFVATGTTYQTVTIPISLAVGDYPSDPFWIGVSLSGGTGHAFGWENMAGTAYVDIDATLPDDPASSGTADTHNFSLAILREASLAVMRDRDKSDLPFVYASRTQCAVLWWDIDNFFTLDNIPFSFLAVGT